jgi:hypothetical protein
MHMKQGLLMGGTKVAFFLGSGGPNEKAAQNFVR